MTAYDRVLVFGLSVITIFVISWSAECGAASKDNHMPDSVERHAQRLIDGLTANGFEVTRGYFRLYTQEDCEYSYEVMGTCYGNNPAAPYVMFAVQPWPEEFVDPATENAAGLTWEGYSSTFRFDPREAIVILGQLPPPAAYFGLQTYLFTREGAFKTDSETYSFIENRFPLMLDSFFTVVPNNTQRIQILASPGNSNNSFVIRNQSGAAFNQERFFIITPDRFMDNAIRKVLAEISVGERFIFTEPIPSTMKTGLDKPADDFLFLMRYAMPKDGGGPGSPSHRWREDLPLTVLRIRDTESERSVEPYGPPVLDDRTAADESSFASDLAKLVAEVNFRWRQPCAEDDCSDNAYKFIDVQPWPLNVVGPLCTEIGMNCLGDTQDTTYQSTFNLTLDNGEVYAVAGTLGTRTGNATYVGLSVNDSLLLKGVANISSNHLKNTANAYAETLKNPSKFYLYYFTRDCSGLEPLTGGHCLSIDEDMIPVCIDQTSDLCHYLKIVQREYIKKGTRRGAESTLILSPMLIKLER
jgi:hypothetical protein